MKVSFEIDLDNDNLAEKLTQLRELENTIMYKITKFKAEKSKIDGDNWMKARQYNYF